MGLREQAEDASRILREVDAVTRQAGGLDDRSGGTLPDVRESDVPAELDVPVHLAWARVMQDVTWVGKQRSEGLKYPYRGIDSIRKAVGPALRKHGVILIPVKTIAEYSTVPRGGGGVMNYCRATVSYQVVGPRGDLLPMGETMGEGFDTGDKATMKAQSVAERTFYITALALPTDQPEMDPEHGPQYEIAAARQPTPDEYASMILDEKVSLNRLSQIKSELASDRRTGSTTVTLANSEEIRLIDLVQREGKRKAAEERPI